MKRSIVNLIGGTLAALVFLISSVAIYSVANAQSQAKTALRKLQASAAVGTNLLQYRQLLIEAQLAVDETRNPRYTQVLNTYKEAAEWWYIGNRSDDMICHENVSDHNLHTLLKKIYGDKVPVIVERGCVPTAAVVQGLFKRADAELQNL